MIRVGGRPRSYDETEIRLLRDGRPDRGRGPPQHPARPGDRAANPALPPGPQARPQNHRRPRPPRAIIERASDGIIVTDESARIKGVNVNLTRLTGLTKDDVEGRAVDDIVTPAIGERARPSARSWRTQTATPAGGNRPHRHQGRASRKQLAAPPRAHPPPATSGSSAPQRHRGARTQKRRRPSAAPRTSSPGSSGPPHGRHHRRRHQRVHHPLQRGRRAHLRPSRRRRHRQDEHHRVLRPRRRPRHRCATPQHRLRRPGQARDLLQHHHR